MELPKAVQCSLGIECIVNKDKKYVIFVFCLGKFLFFVDLYQQQPFVFTSITLVLIDRIISFKIQNQQSFFRFNNYNC
jgi:hypothetical protein